MPRHVYEPANGHGLRHDPLNAIVAPRPIGWIGSRSAAGVGNLAPYSFFNLFNYSPPIVGFASIGRKDSLSNIEETGEFVWNLATRPLAAAMNATSAMVDADIDEMALAGLTATPALKVGLPLVAESPVSFECRKTQIVRLTNVTGTEIDSWLVLGEVIVIHIHEALLADGIYDTAAAQPIVRGGGPGDYFEITPEARFVMGRPA